MTLPGATRFCKICGVEYPYCHTNIPNQYRWQDVACCKEHAAQYFAEIAKSRNESLNKIPDEYRTLLEPEKSAPVVEESKVVDVEEPVTVENVVETVGTKKKSKKKHFSYD